MENEAYRVHRDPTLKLKDGITITDVVGEKGAEFEVAEEFEDEGEEEEAESGYFNREEVFKNLSYICNDGGEDDEDDSSPFQRIEAKMEPITEDGGVQKMLLQAGFGNIVPPDSVVRVHYNAYLEFSDEPFDSTRLRNRVERFRLGTVEPGESYSGEAIAGVSIAVSSMKRGELSRFLIKPEYGFGASGCPPRIPPDATLMYEIELLSFVEDVGVDEISHLTMEERRNLTWAKVKQSCDAGRKEGNILFNETSFRKAQLKYRKAIDVLEQYHLKDEAEEREQRKLLLKLYLNISLCFLKQAHYPPTITYCKRALEIDCKNVKAQFRMGQALHRMGEFDAAKDHLKRAQKLEPKNPDINTELGKLARSVENFHVCETQMYQRMMKPSANPGREPSEPQVSKPNSSSLDDFRNVVRKKLIEMKDNPDMEVMPFPNGSLSPVEICCIMETADDLGLDIIRRGQEPNIQVLVKKKDAST